MRALLASLALLAGCGGQIAVARVQRDIRFNFSNGLCKEPLDVMGISVFEDDEGSRGKTVCDLKRKSLWLHDVLKMKSWIYGQPVGGNYVPVGCPPLTAGRKYGVVVYYGRHGTAHTRFLLRPDGSVAEVRLRGSSRMM
jgi:hypothetical protein